MALFKVDRASASAKPFEKPGTYTVSVIKAEPGITSKGDGFVKLIMRSEDACIVSEQFLNTEKCWWKLNELLVAFPQIRIDDGQEIDLTKRETFNSFLAQFVNQTCQVKLEEETYVKDGEQKKTLRVKKFLPVPGADAEF